MRPRMRALVWHGPREMSVDELPDPEPAPGEVLLEPEAVGVCGSDLEGYAGTQANRQPPLIMGHELAGRVVARGEDVGAEWENRRVAVNPLVHAPDALPGIEQLAMARELIGVHRPGGFASLVRVPAHRLRDLPDDADARLGVLAEPLANGVHAARIGGAGVEGGPTDRALVIGAGAIGLLTLQAVRLGGTEHVGVLERDANRLELAAALGASETFAQGEDAGVGYDLVFDAVGAPATRALTLALLRPGGCAVMLGLATDEAPVAFHDVVRRGLTVRGSYAYTDADYDAALALLLDGRAGLGDLEPILPLDAGPETFAELAVGPTPRVRAYLAP